MSTYLNISLIFLNLFLCCWRAIRDKNTSFLWSAIEYFLTRFLQIPDLFKLQKHIEELSKR